MKTHKVTMVFERETTGTVRFEEVDELGNPVELHESVIGKLYIRKSAIGGLYPSKITVTIESA